ncbi:hypothetical protein CGZ96_09935 [Enemella evansiae]|uniref:2-amino-5-chloromuconate deaminase CnbZ n=1 Tax=Enemella evansiae TaxID=2016499 RepID=UPI000B9612C3|nr:hypothetical protein [Enemella evansiae]OYN98025.1 hypothetical protein CGZ96_09935 [Enemella evansiae]
MDAQDSGRGYRFLPGVSQYSAGVAAADGYSLVRVEAPTVLPLNEGFGWLNRELEQLGVRPETLCAVEMRSPTAMSEGGFGRLNERYRDQLGRLGVLLAGANPVARTNVCPADQPPKEPGLLAFTYAAVGDVPGTFVVSGSAEAPEGTQSYAGSAVAGGDTSTSGLRVKAEWVLDELERRLLALGQSWVACTEVNVYTRHRNEALRALIGARIGDRARTTWWNTTPPVQGLEFEMDCRKVLSVSRSAVAS